MPDVMKVACGMLIDDKHRLLIARRSLSVPHPGLWEFPGGKSLPNEEPISTAVREVKEEVGLTCTRMHFWRMIRHHTSYKPVELYFFVSNQFTGQLQARVGQLALLWVDVQSIHHYTFPTANASIINELQTTGIENIIQSQSIEESS